MTEAPKIEYPTPLALGMLLCIAAEKQLSAPADISLAPLEELERRGFVVRVPGSRLWGITVAGDDFARHFIRHYFLNRDGVPEPVLDTRWSDMRTEAARGVPASQQPTCKHCGCLIFYRDTYPTRDGVGEWTHVHDDLYLGATNIYCGAAHGYKKAEPS